MPHTWWACRVGYIGALGCHVLLVQAVHLGCQRCPAGVAGRPVESQCATGSTPADLCTVELARTAVTVLGTVCRPCATLTAPGGVASRTVEYSPVRRLASSAVCDCDVSALRDNQVRGIVGVFKELPCGIGVSEVGGAEARQRHVERDYAPN